jgi:Carboxypeptidase regulatory-like domain
MEPRWKFRLGVTALLMLLLALALPSYGQSDRGSLTGLVTDSSGALIQRVTVTLTNAATNTARDVVTSDTGKYVFQELPAGTYNLSIKQSGFRTYVQTGITVGVSQAVTQNVSLQVGQVSETVEVNADAMMLRTESAEVSTSVTPEKLSALPVDFGGAMRNPMSFLRLVPGSSVSRDQSWPVTSQNGLQSFSEEIRIDGASSTNPTPGVFNEAQPSVDAIQEINVQTANFNAEYGQAGGAIMNFTLKSGTNKLHGTAYEYLRNEFFNAKNRETAEKTRLRRHEFGGTVGGPVVLPKLYNGRNRTFWFTSWAQYRDREKGQGYYSVPRDEWRVGDLSSLLTGKVLGTDVLGRSIQQGQIYDPASTKTVTVDGQSYAVRDPFINNQLPLRSEVAKKILGFLPKASIPGVDSNNLIGIAGTPLRDEIIWSLKMDHDISPKSRISSSFNYMYTHKINGATPFGDADPARDQTITSKIFRLNHDYTFGTSALNHFTFGLLRYQNPDGVPDRGFDPEASLGLKGTLLKGWFPAVNIDGLSAFGTQQLKHLYHTVPTIVDSFSKVVGAHTFKFGAEYRKSNANFFGGNGAYGGLSFNAAQTALPYLSGSSGSYSLLGSAFASFLLGQAGPGSYLNSAGHYSYRYSDYAFYAQDDFKVTPKLTVNYGLRYDLHRPLTEKYGRISSFVPDLPNPGAGNRLGALGFLGSGSGAGQTGRDSWLDTDKRDFGPRIGVAYKATERTVFRGGFGIVYGRLEVNTFDPIQSNGVGSVNAQYPSIDPATQAQFFLDNGFPPVNVVPPVYDPTLLNNQGLNGYRPESGRLPRIYNWNVTVQFQVTKDMTVEAGYVGNHGTRLITSNFVNQNQNDFSILSMGDKLRQQINSEADANALGVPYPYAGFQGTVAQALRPFPQFRGIGDPQATVGESDYNSLQVKATQRLSKGMDFLVAYTLSKSITTVDDAFGWGGAGSLDAKKLSLERALAVASNNPGDRTHNLAVAFGYEFPFGTLVKNAVAKNIVGGWKLAGILNYTSGSALGLSYPNNLGDVIFNNSGRYDVVPGQALRNNVSGEWPGQVWLFNVNAFQAPEAYKVGNAARAYGAIRGFPYVNEDLALSKRFQIGENKSLELRMDALNALNRSIWNNPDTSVTAAQRMQGGRAIGFGSFWGRSNVERQMQAQVRFTF